MALQKSELDFLNYLIHFDYFTMAMSTSSRETGKRYNFVINGEVSTVLIKKKPTLE